MKLRASSYALIMLVGIGTIAKDKDGKPFKVEVVIHRDLRGGPVMDQVLVYVLKNDNRIPIGSGTMALSGGFFRLLPMTDVLPNTNLQCPNLGMGDYGIIGGRVMPVVYVKCTQEMQDGYFGCGLFARVIRGCNPFFLKSLLQLLNNALFLFAGKVSADEVAFFWISQVFNRLVPFDVSYLQLSNGCWPRQPRMKAAMKKFLPEGYDKDVVPGALPNPERIVTITKALIPFHDEPYHSTQDIK